MVRMIEYKKNSSTTEQIKFEEAAHQYVNAADAAHREGRARYLPALCTQLGVKPITGICQAEIDQAAYQICPNAAPSTRNRQIYTPASAVLKFAAARGWCKYQRIARPRQSKAKVTLPSSTEIDRFMRAASPSLKKIAVFLLYTGASVRETLELEWDQVDLNRRQLRSNGRTMHLHARVAEMLARSLHRHGRVFRRPDGAPYKSTTLRGGQLKTAFRGACQRASIQNITARTLHCIWAARQTTTAFNGGRRNAA